MMVDRYPNLKDEVAGLIPGYEISFLLDKKLVMWSTASCALALACRKYVLLKKDLAINMLKTTVPVRTKMQEYHPLYPNVQLQMS